MRTKKERKANKRRKGRKREAEKEKVVSNKGNKI